MALPYIIFPSVRYNMRVEIAGGTAELCEKRNGLELAELGLEALTVHLKVFAEVGGRGGSVVRYATDLLDFVHHHCGSDTFGWQVGSSNTSNVLNDPFWTQYRVNLLSLKAMLRLPRGVVRGWACRSMPVRSPGSPREHLDLC